MTLTPEDVRKKTFTPVRLREGYDMGEVDQFLDEVEVELTRLHQESDDLRAKLTGPSTATSTPASASASASASTAAPEQDDTEVPSSMPAMPVATTIPEASGAAARLLEIAAHNADQLVSEAQNEADKIVGEATIKAERLDTESKEKAERFEVDSRARSEQLDTEMSQRREQLLGDLERDRDNLARELEDLRAFEREYCSRLRAYFESQLSALDGEGDDAVPLSPSTDPETPSRLRDLLSEDPQE
ncbi:MAG: DivIVA domain-containing protein [Propionibacteriales bacterium]|nr:DivIVA domain-containing protein [Propionibacteriales bacterium]